LLGGKEKLKPHFLQESWGFLMTSSWMGLTAYGNEAAIATAIQKRLQELGSISQEAGIENAKKICLLRF
jgi:hypothetical protein